ncbi:MAG: hypothetical protein LBN43_09695 [Oscillospiraceae bacterium]|nr:hypothetical protein [Oscillospiraceae bacterium]
MKLEIFQKIRLKSGKTAHVVEIFNNGEAYLADVNISDGEYATETIYPEDIQSVIIEVDKPFTALA